MSGMNNQLTPKTIVHAEMSAHQSVGKLLKIYLQHLPTRIDDSYKEPRTMGVNVTRH